MERIIGINYGEVSLKGMNKSLFVNRLIKNIKARLKTFDGVEIVREQGRLYAQGYDPEREEDLLRALGEVFGIYSLIPSVKFEGGLEEIRSAVVSAAGEHLSRWPAETFKVETKRVNKKFPMKSPQVCRELGASLLQAFPGLGVDVHHPAFEVFVEIRRYNLVYTRRVYTLGGLPYKTGGKAMLLLSGGIDSPVAGWLTAKRGLEIEAVHFHSYPFTSERAEEKVLDLARHLCRYMGRMKVHSVNLLPIQKAINTHCKEEEMTILSRRFMMRIAERIALENGCQALVTGECLGQVASQTIESIGVTNQTVDLPVIRPLIAVDKTDIMDLAQKIGTFETSIQPFEDCCTVFLPKKPLTKPKLGRILESEKHLEVEALTAQACEERKIHDIRNV